MNKLLLNSSIKMILPAAFVIFTFSNCELSQKNTTNEKGAFSNYRVIETQDSICQHKVFRDENGRLLSWIEPEVPGKGYDKVVNLAANFIKDCPIEDTSGLPYYMVHSWIYTLETFGEEKFKKGLTGSEDSNNPACTFANFVQSFAIDYKNYSGDTTYIGIVRRTLDHMIDNGSTPKGWQWSEVPYASSNPRHGKYIGGTRWGEGGRADGKYAIECDKVGELGYAYLRFYETTGEKKYLEAAINCADALAKNAFKNVYTGPFWSEKQTIWEDRNYVSPWPFRVKAETGETLDEYTSNVVEPIKLFDELIRIKDKVELDTARLNHYSQTRKDVWDWLYSISGPMKSMVWTGYFEDIPHDTFKLNRNQVTPMEHARYILKKPELDPKIDDHVPMLLSWVVNSFKDEKYDAIKEQFWCYVSMGSHTARYASICAMWYERTGDERYKDEAFRYFNWATYMAQENGFIHTMDWNKWRAISKQVWFTDGYGDYVRHFFEGMAAIPEWAPADENHLLKSSSIITQIQYKEKEITYSTFDNQSDEVLRLTSKPINITLDGKLLPQTSIDEEAGWKWEDLPQGGGVLRVNKKGGTKVVLSL